MEYWKRIHGYDYSVSNEGNVRNETTGRISAGRKSGNGYRKVSFYKNNEIVGTEYVHRLVASAFLQKGKEETEVNHIDGNKENNRIENLEWVTSSGNTEHAVATGAFLPWGKARKPIFATNIENGESLFFKSIGEAERVIGTRHISHVLNGTRRHAKGYTFRYAQGGDANAAS